MVSFKRTGFHSLLWDAAVVFSFFSSHGEENTLCRDLNMAQLTETSVKEKNKKNLKAILFLRHCVMVRLVALEFSAADTFRERSYDRIWSGVQGRGRFWSGDVFVETRPLPPLPLSPHDAWHKQCLHPCPNATKSDTGCHDASDRVWIFTSSTGGAQASPKLLITRTCGEASRSCRIPS